MLSTRNLAPLPDIPTLLRLTQSLAMLDAILSPEWDYRYYSFNAHWSAGQQLASMRNGSGDDWQLIFCPEGAILKGFAHEYPMAEGTTWSGVLDQVPSIFEFFLHESSFLIEDTTFCIWRTIGDDRWRRGEVEYPPGDDPDGSAFLLEILDGNPRTYQAFAEDYYEKPVPLSHIKAIYAHRPLTARIAAQLNPEITLEDLAEDIAEIGYPA